MGDDSRNWKTSATAILRLGFAVVLFALSLLAVFRAPTYTLWMISIVVTEWGHYLAILALLVLLPGWTRTRTGLAAASLAVIAAIFALTPLIRAMDTAERAEAALGGEHPLSSPGAPPHLTALRARSLFTRPAAPEVRRTTETYATRDAQKLDVDVYRRAGERAPEPLVMIIHGGSWTGGTRGDLPALNSYLAARGYVVASPGYRLAPRFRHPAQTEDINAAIDFLKTNAPRLGIDNTKLFLIGRSAGGHLALMSAYTKHDPAIRGVVSFYGPTDQKWGWENPSDAGVYDSFATLRAFLGGDPTENPEGYRSSSPLAYAESSSVPTLLIHGSRDPLVYAKQSIRLDSALTDNGQRSVLIEMPWATHGCDYFINGPCGQISTYAVERFLASLM